MYIAENGPILVRSDKLLKRALDNYWKGETQDGKWHFIHRDDRHYYAPISLTVRRLQNQKSKFSFVDK